MPVYKLKNINAVRPYYIHGTVKGKQYHIRGFETKEEAQDYEDRYCDLIENPNRNSKRTVFFDTLAYAYIDEDLSQWKETYVYNSKIVIKKYILGRFGQVRIGAMQYVDFLEWWKVIRDLDMCHRNKVTIHGMLKNICKYAKKRYEIDLLKIVEQLPRFPDRIEAPKETIVYTIDDFVKLISHVSDIRMLAIFSIIFFMGLRVSEIRALTWDDSVLMEDKKMIIYRQATCKIGKRKTVFLTPKSAKSRRTLMIPDIVLALLTKVRAQSKISLIGSFVFPSGFRTKRQRETPIGSTMIKRRLDAAAELAGLPQIDPHELRHSFATFLNNQVQISSEDISTLMGHSTKSVTEKYYLHSYANAKKIVNEKINRYVAGFIDMKNGGK